MYTGIVDEPTVDVPILVAVVAVAALPLILIPHVPEALLPSVAHNVLELVGKV